MRAGSLILFLLTVLSSGNVHSSQTSYQFTQAFTNCVRSHGTEAKDQQTGGSAVSGLMNGSDLSGKGALSKDKRYWAYMNCLNNAVGGTAKTALPVAKTCKPSGKLPPGTEGKVFSYGGASWTCANGNWSGSGSLPGEVNNKTPCPAKTVKEGSCSFSSPEMAYNSSITLTDNAFSNGDFYQGRILLSCQGGEATVESKSCVIQSCEAGQNLTWHSSNTDSSARCEGQVSSDGESTHQHVVRFFSSLQEAKLSSNVNEGSASFICEDNRWKLNSGDCRKKSIDELRCSQRVNSIGKMEFSCI